MSDRENSKKLNQHQRIQVRKIFRLCAKFENTCSFDPDAVVFNFSNRLITDKEKEILSKGLNFAIPPTKLKLCGFLTPFEKFYHQLKREPFSTRSGFSPDSIKTKIKDIALSGFRSYSRPNFLYTQDDINTLNDLKNDSNIIITKPDKGNGVVILNIDDYNRKMDEILSDNSKFELLNDDPVKVTLQRENQVKSLLKKLKAADSINQETYNELYPTGSRIGILYGLPKIHKSTIPLRPILSSVNHYSYKIARFFIPLLNPISVSSLMIKDSFSFVQELLNSDIDSSKVVMASFDVTSLFTNIPLYETIDIISNRIFSNCKRFQGLNRSEFEKLLTLSVKNCHFMFNGRLFHQIDGVAMGSPLGPLFANIFMSFHEKTWLDSCPSSFKPLLYRRYVDDCFLLFRSLDHVPLFLDYLNCQHPNISFTSEIEHEGKLPFLDIDISRSSGKFTTSVYRKPTFTGLFTNFQSFIPLTYKRSLVSCLLHRIFNLCSSYENFHAQLEVIRKLFNLNGFPSHMFDWIVRHFLDNTFQPKPSILTAPKKIIYFCLPFTGSHSLQIRTQINRLCNAAFPHLDIRFVFRISSFFPFKDKVPKFLRSGVVYSFKCRCCSASYVGQSTRHLHTRISEHLGISPITGKPSSSPAMSSIFSHINSSGHSASFDDFKIISSSSDSYELMIHESLLISKLKPSLNVQGCSIPLNLF